MVVLKPVPISMDCIARIVVFCGTMSGEKIGKNMQRSLWNTRVIKQRKEKNTTRVENDVHFASCL